MGLMQKQIVGQKLRKTVLGSVLGFTVLASANALAAEPATNEDFQQQLAAQSDRISALENKLDSLIELLTNSPFLNTTAPAQQPAGASPTSTVSGNQTAVTTQANALQLKPGIYVDFYLVPSTNNWDKVPSSPSGPSLSSFRWDKGLTFSRNIAQLDPTAKTMSGAGGKEIGLLASGVIEITETGTHVFALSTKNQTHNVSYCRSSLMFDGKKVADARTDRNSMGTTVHEADLTPGFYEIATWQTCGDTNRGRNFWEYNDAVTTSVSIKAPSDRAMQPISGNMIGHLE